MVKNYFQYGGWNYYTLQCGTIIEIVIKFLQSRRTIFSAHTNVIKITIPKLADTSKDELLLGGEIRHLTATSQYHAHRKQVPACVISNIV